MKGKINKNDLVEIKKAICSYENVSMKLLKRFGFLRHSQIFEQLFVLINTKETFWNIQALKYR